MTARILDGRPLARQIEAVSALKVLEFREKTGRSPALQVILVSGNPASEVYVGRKRQACDRTGIDFELLRLDDTSDLQDALGDAFFDDKIDGVILQLPLPNAESPVEYFVNIPPKKDVDVFHPMNIGDLEHNIAKWKPCTPHAVLRLLRYYDIKTDGQNIVIVNRSWVVGRPLAGMSLHTEVNGTVTVCHDRTPLHVTSAHCRAADIIVMAVGQPGFLTPDMVSEGQTVIDVGINRVEDRVIGDAHPDVAKIVANLTPVPGGVGPVTVAVLIENVVTAALWRQFSKEF